MAACMALVVAAPALTIYFFDSPSAWSFEVPSTSSLEASPQAKNSNSAGRYVQWQQPHVQFPHILDTKLGVLYVVDRHTWQEAIENVIDLVNPSDEQLEDIKKARWIPVVSFQNADSIAIKGELDKPFDMSKYN